MSHQPPPPSFTTRLRAKRPNLLQSAGQGLFGGRTPRRKECQSCGSTFQTSVVQCRRFACLRIRPARTLSPVPSGGPVTFCIRSFGRCGSNQIVLAEADEKAARKAEQEQHKKAAVRSVQWSFCSLWLDCPADWERPARFEECEPRVGFGVRAGNRQ